MLPSLSSDMQIFTKPSHSSQMSSQNLAKMLTTLACNILFSFGDQTISNMQEKNCLSCFVEAKKIRNSSEFSNNAFKMIALRASSLVTLYKPETILHSMKRQRHKFNAI